MLCAASPLFAKTLPPLPEPVFVDGEVSRCYPFDQAGIGSIWIDLSASFIGMASNNLEIAFGTDANRDGDLSLRETDLILGWSCGCYFLERFKACEVNEETNVGTNDIACALGWNSRVRRDGRILSLVLTNECVVAFADVLSSPPSWIYDTRWDRMRITARGEAARDARFNFVILSRGNVIDQIATLQATGALVPMDYACGSVVANAGAASVSDSFGASVTTSPVEGVKTMRSQGDAASSPAATFSNVKYGHFTESPGVGGGSARFIAASPSFT